MNVVIDLGNSAAKVGIFDHQHLKEKLVFQKMEDLERYIKNFSARNLIISSVNTDANKIASWATNFREVILLSHSLPVPFNSYYKTPETLGVDRIAAICGASDLFPGKNCLVVDTGTCITYDFIDRNLNYFGGGISPGLTLRFRAMNSFTARLPLVEPAEDPALIGNSTVTCMQSGVILGIVEELDGIIRRYSEKFEDLQVILTGGDCIFFENKLKASIFASPELVLRGLNSILLYNVSD
jgi:type III pantothenate kinase